MIKLERSASAIKGSLPKRIADSRAVGFPRPLDCCQSRSYRVISLGMVIGCRLSISALDALYERLANGIVANRREAESRRVNDTFGGVPGQLQVLWRCQRVGTEMRYALHAHLLLLASDQCGFSVPRPLNNTINVCDTDPCKLCGEVQVTGREAFFRGHFKSKLFASFDERVCSTLSEVVVHIERCKPL